MVCFCCGADICFRFSGSGLLGLLGWGFLMRLRSVGGSGGLTLVEFLVMVALIVVVAAVAFPVLTNVFSAATSSAHAASASALANFPKEWANAPYRIVYVTPAIPGLDAKYDGDTVAYSDDNRNGVWDFGEQVVAVIKGNAVTQ